MRKRCTKCGKNRLVKFFYKDGRLRSGLKSQCLLCSKAYSKKWKLTNRAKKFWKKWSKARRLKTYGITEEQYVNLLKKQNGKCAVCRTKLKNKRQPSIDHNHTTKKIRGILCNNCNTLLGLAKECVRTLMRAIKYLTKETK